MDLFIQLVFSALILMQFFYIFMLEGRMDKAMALNTAQIHVINFNTFYNTMTMLMDNGEFEPVNYTGYRCEFILDTYFEIFPYAKELIKVDIEKLKINDIFYGATHNESDFSEQ